LDVESFKREIEGAIGDIDIPITAPSAPIEPRVDDAFPAALKELLKHEGGYCNHPSDLGGRTKLGVTQRVWEAWTGKRATEAAMRGLKPDMVAPLYRKHYWDTVKAGELPGGLALTVFDFGVNAGPGRAMKFLQQLAGRAGGWSDRPMTIASVKTYFTANGEAAAIRAYSDLRRQ
jgi:lysozyme family protein